MRAVELRRNVHSQLTLSQRVSGVFRVRSGRKEVSTECKEDACFSSMHRFDRVHGVKTVASRWFKVELGTKPVKKRSCRAFPDSHRSIALNIAVPSDGTKPSSRFADLTSQQHQIHDLLDIGYSVLMLRQAHGPTKNCAFGFNKDFRGILYLGF